MTKSTKRQRKQAQQSEKQSTNKSAPAIPAPRSSAHLYGSTIPARKALHESCYSWEWPLPRRVDRRIRHKLLRVLTEPLKASVTWEELIVNASRTFTPRTREQQQALSQQCTTVIGDSSFVTTDTWNGVNSGLLLYLRRGLDLPKDRAAGEGLVQLVTKCIEMLEMEYPPPRPKSRDVRHQRNRELMERSPTCGLYHIAEWFATGHVTGKPILSADIVGSAHKLGSMETFMRKTTPLQQFLAVLFAAFDPDTYLKYQQATAKAKQHSAWRLFSLSPRACFMGAVLLRNLQAEPHRDKGDKKDGWVAMVCFGNFAGGYLVLPDLGMKINFRPGDVIFLRSALLEHFVDDWEPILCGAAPGRSSFVFFFHENVFNWASSAGDDDDDE